MRGEQFLINWTGKLGQVGIIINYCFIVKQKTNFQYLFEFKNQRPVK